MTHEETFEKIEGAFMAGRDQPPTHIRVDEHRTYRVEWVRNVQPATPADSAPSGSLIATLEAYSEELDETLTAMFVVRPARDDPRRPDWTSMQPAPWPAPRMHAKAESMLVSPSASPAVDHDRTAGVSPSEGAASPSWRRSTCLACRRPVVRARHAHNLIGGTLSGSWLVVWPSGPELMATTDPIPLDESIYLLGACHRSCLEQAHALARQGCAAIRAPLAELKFDEVEGDYTLHLPADESACLFCNSRGPLTDEHIWPLWLSRELRSMGATFAPRPGSTRHRTSIDFTVPVCKACNNEWLSVLENDVATLLRPMVRGHFVTLSSEQQVRLATWATKTAFLIDRAGDPIVPRGFPIELAISREPLSSVMVFLAAYQGKRAAFAYQNRLPASVGDEAHPGEAKGFVVTFNAYKVVFQVIGHFSKGDVTWRDGRAGLRGAMVQLSPLVRHEVTWPPAIILPDEGVDALAASVTAG